MLAHSNQYGSVYNLQCHSPFCCRILQPGPVCPDGLYSCQIPVPRTDDIHDCPETETLGLASTSRCNRVKQLMLHYVRAKLLCCFVELAQGIVQAPWRISKAYERSCSAASDRPSLSECSPVHPQRVHNQSKRLMPALHVWYRYLHRSQPPAIVIHFCTDASCFRHLQPATDIRAAHALLV